MTIRHLTRAAAASVAAVGVGLMSTTAPASAVIVDISYPEIYGANVQFGALNDPFDMIQGILQPGGPGLLEWDLTSGTVTPRLRGTMHTGGIGGRCAKMRLRYYAENNGQYQLLDARSSPPHCPIDDDYEVRGVNMAPFSDPDIVRVLVSTTLENSNGRFDDILTQQFDLS